MKKILTLLLSMLIGGTLFAQSLVTPTLSEKLDMIIAEKTAIIPTLLERIDTARASLDSSLNPLLDNIIIYLQEGYDQRIAENETATQEDAITIPQGFTVLNAATLQRINQYFHYEGNADAPIAVVEFIDFQCPFCRKQHTDRVLDTLRERFPDTVRTAAGMFPLQGQYHELAQVAAESAECAFRQGGVEAFYDHKDGLYAAGLQPSLSVIKRVAGNNGLDVARLEECINGQYLKDLIKNQKIVGQSLGVRGTPGTIIVDMRTGASLTRAGALSVDVFANDIQQLIDA